MKKAGVTSGKNLWQRKKQTNHSFEQYARGRTSKRHARNQLYVSTSVHYRFSI